MNQLLMWAASLLISQLTEKALNPSDITRIKNFIVDLETRAINKAIKHEQAALLIREITADLSDHMVDWVIRTIRWTLRKTGGL
jgi:hypothetical protein